MTTTTYEQIPAKLEVGRQGEHNAHTIVIDVSELVGAYTEPVVKMMLTRPGITTPYEGNTTYGNNLLTWVIDSFDTRIAGRGQFQIRVEQDGELVKSKYGTTIIEPSIDMMDEETPTEVGNFMIKASNAIQRIYDATDMALSAVEAVAKGSVLSVNNKVGIVDLLIDDIPSLREHLDNADSRIDATNASVGNIGSTVEGYDTRITEAEQKAQSVISTVNAFDGRITALENGSEIFSEHNRNENLLYNWCFRRNVRNAQATTGGKYFADGWKATGNASSSAYVSNGRLAEMTGTIEIEQRVPAEDLSAANGKYTFSVYASGHYSIYIKYGSQKFEGTFDDELPEIRSVSIDANRLMGIDKYLTVAVNKLYDDGNLVRVYATKFENGNSTLTENEYYDAALDAAHTKRYVNVIDRYSTLYGTNMYNSATFAYEAPFGMYRVNPVVESVGVENSANDCYLAIGESLVNKKASELTVGLVHDRIHITAGNTLVEDVRPSTFFAATAPIVLTCEDLVVPNSGEWS